MDGQLKPGTYLTSESGNKYEVVSLLGAGGQGEVYDVESSGRHYALKWYFKATAHLTRRKRWSRLLLMEARIRHSYGR